MKEYSYWLPLNNGESKEITTTSNSVIFIGANGAGKSRLGAWMEKYKPEQVHRIGAQRNLNFDDNIPLKSFAEAEDLVMYGNASLANRQQKFYKYHGQGQEEDNYILHLFNDFTDVLSALIAKSNNEITAFYQECKKAEEQNKQHPKTKDTVIDKLKLIWSDIFQQCNIECKDSHFSAYAFDKGSELDYSATKMSDGERTALYFIAQVLCVPSGKIILIDEPELHLHRSLMNRLWCSLEKHCPDCLFIYITHDTQFAALHIHADKYWVKHFDGHRTWDIERIDTCDFPEDLLLDLLGNRKNVLFVEGTAGSFDVQLYSLIYKNYYVVPCGSCEQVIARTKAFNNTAMLHHIQAYGIIDRDYRTNYEIDSYKKYNIFTVDVAEVENLFITEELIKSVTLIHGCNNTEEVFQAIKRYVIEERFKKQIDSQVCQAVISEIKYKLGIIEIDKKNATVAKISLDRGLASINFENIKKDVEGRFYKVLTSYDYRSVIRIFNEKGIAKSVGHFMSLQDNKYCETVIGMMNNGIINIEQVMGNYMPSIFNIPR